MRVHVYSAAAALLVCAVASCYAADGFTSGVPAGESIGSYSGTKCGGAEDGVEVGKSLCYT